MGKTFGWQLVSHNNSIIGSTDSSSVGLAFFSRALLKCPSARRVVVTVTASRFQSSNILAGYIRTLLFSLSSYWQPSAAGRMSIDATRLSVAGASRPLEFRYRVIDHKDEKSKIEIALVASVCTFWTGHILVTTEDVISMTIQKRRAGLGETSRECYDKWLMSSVDSSHESGGLFLFSTSCIFFNAIRSVQ